MDHGEIAETYGFMNSANGVLIVADHDCFLHTSNIHHHALKFRIVAPSKEPRP